MENVKDNSLEVLLEKYDQYWNTDEIDIDLANTLVESVPKLVRRIQRLEAYAESLDGGSVSYKGEYQSLNGDMLKLVMGEDYSINNLHDLVDVIVKYRESNLL